MVLPTVVETGICFKQICKDEYLVWDSDTVPLSELNFKDEEGHDLVLVKKERHVPYFNTIDGLFHAPKKAPYSFISEHMLFNVSIVKEMLSLIEENPNSNFLGLNNASRQGKKMSFRFSVSLKHTEHFAIIIIQAS